MNLVFKQTIDQIINDREHGSAELLHQIQQVFADNRNLSESEITWAFDRLSSINLSMVVIHHFIQKLKPEIGNHFYAHLDAYIHYWQSVNKQIARRFLGHFALNNRNILTHSRSGTVMHLLLRKPVLPMKVFQTRSLPEGEGKMQGKVLQEAGIKVEMIDIDDIKDNCLQIDLAVVGCDQYNDQYFINKTGTRSILEQTNHFNIPFIVLADSRKKVNQLTRTNHLFEKIPFHGGVHLFTEQGHQLFTESPFSHANR